MWWSLQLLAHETKSYPQGEGYYQCDQSKCTVAWGGKMYISVARSD